MLAAASQSRQVQSADDAGARLVALELALSGAPREQADTVLSEHFSLGDARTALLDDVYAAASRAS